MFSLNALSLLPSLRALLNCQSQCQTLLLLGQQPCSKKVQDKIFETVVECPLFQEKYALIMGEPYVTLRIIDAFGH